MDEEKWLSPSVIAPRLGIFKQRWTARSRGLFCDCLHCVAHSCVRCCLHPLPCIYIMLNRDPQYLVTSNKHNCYLEKYLIKLLLLVKILVITKGLHSAFLIKEILIQVVWNNFKRKPETPPLHFKSDIAVKALRAFISCDVKSTMFLGWQLSLFS